MNDKPAPAWIAGLVAVVFSLTGCNEKTQSAQSCFSILPGSNSQPFAPVLVDACTGKTWLMVRSSVGTKPEEGYTYHWMTMERFDGLNPVLVPMK